MKKLNELQSYLTRLRGLMLTLIILCSIGVGNVWGADPATGSWTFNSALATGWTKVENGESYCGGWGCKKSVKSYTVRTTNNVSDFTTILTDPSNSNFSLTITVTGVCNSGTNKCTVTLLNSSNTKVGSLEQTKSNGFGSGTNAQAAKDVVFTFAPTSTVARIQVIGYNKTAITKVSYSLSYTSGPACSDPATALSISASPASITTDGTSTLSTTGGNGGTVTYTITSANASSASIVENTFSATAAGTYTVQASQDENGGTCGGTATVNITVRYQVKWSVNGNDSYTTGSPTTYIGTHDTKVATLPTSPASGLCDGSKVFVGWTATPIVGTTNTIPTDLFTTAAGSPNVTDNVTYYAVFATVGTATFQASDITNTPATGNTREWGHTASGTLLYLSAGQYYTGGTPYTWTVTAGTSNYARFTAGSGKTITQIVVTISGTNYKINSVTEGTLSTSSTTQTITGINNSTVDCKATSSYQIRITQAVVTYASAFATSCCTPLGTINGSVAFTNPAAAVVSWDNLEHVSSWTVKYKVHGAANWTTWEGAQSTASSRRSVTITTICNTAYDFLIIATPASGYCDKEEELNNSGSGYNSGKWIVGYTLTDINKTSGPDASANVCGDFSAIFAATNSKVLPATITVTIGGSAQTAGTDYTWDQSSGTLSISSAKITGTIAITISGATAAYQFWYGPSNSGDGWISTAFASVGNNEHQITNFVIPAFEWDGSKQLMWNVSGSGISATNREFYAMTFAHTQSVCGNYDYYNDGKNKDGWIRGPMPGAIGTLRIYDNKGDNGWCAFIPNEYVLKFGTSEILFTNNSGSVWETAITDLSSLNSGSWTGSTTYQVGVGNSSHSFVAISNKCPATALSSMGYKTNAGENWGTGLNNISSARGKFRIWIDNCSNNWVAHFVPYHRVVFHSNYPEGGGPADTYAGETSVEESNASIALNPAPTAPTGYTFDGWYDAASGGNKITTPLSISAGASADIELYAQWAANTINLTLDKNNSDVSGSSNGSGTIMFDGNATATITGATRTGHTVEGYYSDAECTAANKVLDANGNVINSTVSGYTTSGKWTRAMTPTTLYTKWTPNNYTITWSVNNQTWTNGVTDANNHANHGATVNAPAGDGNVPTGAAMPCGTYTFMGWSATITPTSADGGTAPADLFTTTSPAITKETTFYAVFAEGGKGYTRATQVSDITVGSHIIIGYEADHSEAQGTVVPARSGDYEGTSYMRSGTTSGSSNNNTIDLTSSVANESDYVFTVEAGHNTGYFALKGSDNKYIGHNGKNAAKAYDAIDTDGKTDYSFAFGENDVVTITNKWGNENTTTDGSKSYYFQWLRYNSTNYRFAIYRTGQNDPVIYIVNSASNYKTYCDDTKAYVNYNPAGGTTSCTREAVTKGTNYTVCSYVPTKTGYTFQGWLSNETTPQTYQPNATISNVQNDIVLTAQWTATTYTITYNGVKTGAENTNPTSYTVEDLPINLVAATHDQWRFDGWTDDNAGNADITTIPAGTTGNQSFTAHWTQRYAVTWYEESTPTVTYFDPGTTLQFPADPSAPASCSEKKFVGWMVGTITGETDDKPTFVTAGEVNADAAYHAVWATQYEESGTKTLFSDQLLVTGTAEVSTPRDGWSSILYAYGYNGNGIRLSSSNNGASMTVDLSGKELGSTLTITFDAAKYGNENGALSLSCLDEGANPTFSPASFTISNVSWEEKSCTITNVDENVKSITLTGTKNQRFYMKNFKVTTSGMITKYKEYSTSCCDNNVAAPSVMATATRNSITLSWANVTDATGYKVTINGGTHEVTTAACTYTESGLTSGTDYAWTVIATYNPANYCGAIPTKNTTTTLSVYGVTYNKNTTIGSGTVTMSPMPSDASTYVVGENVTAAAKPATCTNSGYTFNGWNTKPDGTGTHVDAGGTIAMVEGGLTLYAEWVAKRAYYVDRMHGQGDQTIEIGGKTYHCYYGDGYHITPSPSDQKSGDACQAPHYRFVRWLTIGHINADGTQKDTGGAVSGGVQRGTVTDGETYYAIWEEEIE